MAKLSAHGHQVGRIEFLTYAKAYCADGKILKNDGSGWKLHSKCKPGITPEAAYAAAVERQRAFLADRPMHAAYRKALHDMAGLSKRWKLHLAVQMMPQDPDGVWSEACDGYGDNVHADVDEVCELCRLYESAMTEQAELKDPTNAVAQFS